MDGIKFSCRFQMLLIFSILFLLHLTSSQLVSRPVEVSVSLPETATYGSFVELTCSWFLKPKNILKELIISGSESPLHVTFTNVLVDGQYRLISGAQSNNRISFRGEPTKMIMKVEDLQCSDEQIYTCMCVYLDVSSGNPVNKSVSDTAHLLIKVPPGSVNITNALPDSTEAGDHQQVLAEEDVSIVCSGISGVMKHPIFEWTIFRNSYLEHVSIRDSRIKGMESVPSLPTDLSCSRRVQQVITVNSGSCGSVMVISCFLRYNDTPVEKGSIYCWKSTKEICIRSLKFKSNFELGGDSSPAVIIVSIGLYTILVGFIVGAALSYVCCKTDIFKKSDFNEKI